MKCRCFLILLLTACLVAGTANGAVLTTDRFDGTAVDPNVWDVYSGSGTITVSGGELTIDTVGATTGITTKDAATFNYFIIRMKILEAPTQGSTINFTMYDGVWPAQTGAPTMYTNRASAEADLNMIPKISGDLTPLWGGWVVELDKYYVCEWDARVPSATVFRRDGVASATYDWSAGGSWDHLVLGQIGTLPDHVKIVVDYVTTDPNYRAVPVITTQPVSQSVYIGDSVTLTVEADNMAGDPCEAYQWRFDNGSGPSDIPSATSASYTDSDFQAGDVGDYDCVLTNSHGSVTSNAATLTEGVCGDAWHPYPQGDLDEDCKVELADLALFAANWLECKAASCP